MGEMEGLSPIRGRTDWTLKRDESLAGILNNTAQKRKAKRRDDASNSTSFLQMLEGL